MMKKECRKILEMLANEIINVDDAQLLLETIWELDEPSHRRRSDLSFDFAWIKTFFKEYGRMATPTLQT